MKKVLFCLLFASCTVQKQVPVYNSEAKIIFFCKESEDSNEINVRKSKSWVERLQVRFPDLYFVSRSFNVESSRDFKEQLQRTISEEKPKAVLSYEFIPHSKTTFRNKFILILSDSTNNMIKDKVYHNYAWLAMPDILPDFAKELESLELKYKK
ncbi:hypothetical protein [Flectobacillus rivi]|uniref:Lipoprotein n=1 Tax=Flectobacillus rivi TaxID=2984209 RepID=A0ABT6Z0J5_9BACT|nr:hypothetical protein [Flectobacillus rivi]MDI9874651.1 hypothetical protein [Flectobacillus rivi]